MLGGSAMAAAGKGGGRGGSNAGASPRRQGQSFAESEVEVADESWAWLCINCLGQNSDGSRKCKDCGEKRGCRECRAAQRGTEEMGTQPLVRSTLTCHHIFGCKRRCRGHRGPADPSRLPAAQPHLPPQVSRADLIIDDLIILMTSPSR